MVTQVAPDEVIEVDFGAVELSQRSRERDQRAIFIYDGRGPTRPVLKALRAADLHDAGTRASDLHVGTVQVAAPSGP